MRVEIHRIGGDVYVNHDKVAFAVDFTNPPTEKPQHVNIDWLLGWARIGLISRGHDVPHFEVKPLAAFETPITPRVEAA